LSAVDVSSSARKVPVRGLTQGIGHALRLRGPLANEPGAKLLHALLMGVAVSTVIELTLGLPFWYVKLASAGLMVVMGLATAVALVLVHRGAARAAGWVYLCGIGLVSTTFILLSGGIHSPGIIFYFALSISAAWLVGYRAALVFGGVSLGILLIMAVLDLKGMFPPAYLPSRPIPIWLDCVAVMVIALVPVARVLQSVKDALTLSRYNEVALRDSNEHFRAIFHQSGIGVAQISLEGRVELANDRYCEVVGHSQDDLLGKGTFEITHSEDLNRQLTMMPKLLAGEIQSFAAEKRYMRKDGKVIWAMMWKSLVRNAEGKPKCIIAIVEDITERKHSEAALRESEQRFRNMADTAPVMIVMSDPDGRATFFNKGWLAFRGRTLAQELGTGWMEGVHPNDLQGLLAGLSASHNARQDCSQEYRLRRTDGEYRWVLCNGVPRLEGNVFVGYIASAMDITDLRRMQEEALTQKKLEGLGLLAAGVAHDFNNLLGSILASAELILDQHPKLSHPEEEELLRITSAAIRGGEIVRQLMIYSGEERQALEPVDISQLVGEMIDLLKVSISKHATLKLNLGEKLPKVVANATHIRQVIINLITNASEAIGQNEGVISVTVEHVASGLDAEARNALLHDFIRLEVSDTGCGMTEEVRAKMFDPFFSTKFAGRGLGLAAVQGTVHRHGGLIRVQSVPGQGSRFEILLPCGNLPEPDTANPGEPSAASEGPAGTTVLIIEDEDALRSATAKILRKAGFSIIEAGEGAAALNLFRANEPEIDVVLLDMTLPGMSGSELLEKMREIRPDIKVVLTSAYNQDRAEATVGRIHPWKYIQKPYQLRELTDLLLSVAGQKTN
jgi:two-component system, cell cycle sensor histidine kinase and response regulator CckA